MKKRFTLMMMVLCFLMSIPLKMMADEVTIHFVDKESTKWESYAAYVYDKTITGNGSQPWVTDKWPGQKVTNSADIETLANGYKVVTWKIDLKSCALSNALVIFNNQDNGKQCPASGQPGKEVKNGYYYYSDGTMSDTAPSGTETGGGTEGGGSTGPTEKWDTEKINRLTEKPRVYSQGFYLAGNFFTFDEKDKINYDDAVFKFQQQKDQDISIVEDARTVYDIYKVEIPASLTAHAQVMYVDEFGKTKSIFGPGKYSISRTCPETDKSKGWLEAKPYVCDPTNKEIDNCWNFVSRNETENEYSDGMYNLYIAVDSKAHTVVKWKIEHDSDRRVAYFISDAPDASAMPIYDAYDSGVKYFSNRFYGSVNFAENRSYYVISNIVRGHEDAIVNRTKENYGTVVPTSVESDPKSKYNPTTNKLFLMGNGGLDFADKNPNNSACPNEKPIKFGADWSGNQIVEYNPNKGYWDRANTDEHLGFAGEVQFQSGKRVKITSVSMVGDAIPGTFKVDKTTGKEVWDFTSKAADMTYDDVEQCYATTIVTTVGDGKKHFRFVGNHDPKINWFEDTDGTELDKMAKTPYKSTDPNVHGHTADANDPNQVNYTQEGAYSGDNYHILWNRPAGRWTVRLYFYTRNVDGQPVTDYYYTITENRDMELHDVGDVVYGSLDNKQIITNLDGYKFMRTWSAQKAWKISDKVDIFVVSKIADDESGVVKMTLTKINGDETGVYNVIPAYTGVILATKSDASEIPGAKFKSREDFTSYNNLVIPMEQYDTDVKYNGINKLEPILVSRVIPSFENDKYNYLFGYYNTQIATGDKIKHEANEYLLGFWISKGSKPYSSNSSYLPIDKVTAAKMKYLGTSSKDYVTGGGSSAKKAPGVIFDFTNVGGTTGINEVVNQSAKLNDGKYYTLSGQQVEKPTAGGIYIHNGRKFVVK